MSVWVGAPQNWHDDKVFNRSSRRSCSVKKVFLEILQNSQENTYARDVFFNQVVDQALVGRLGTRLSFYEIKTLSWYFLISHGPKF